MLLCYVKMLPLILAAEDLKQHFTHRSFTHATIDGLPTNIKLDTLFKASRSIFDRLKHADKSLFGLFLEECHFCFSPINNSASWLY